MTKNIFSAIHDQGQSAKCWAYAISTMLRNSLRLKIDSAPISNDLRDLLLAKLNDKNHHKRMRCELMMVVTPTRMNTDDDNQSAILALVMDRVNMEVKKKYFEKK